MRDPNETIEIGRLKRRADFLRVGRGKRWHAEALSVQAAPAPQTEDIETEGDVRIGFTLTRKVGNAVVRNRARRRLKEAVRLTTDLPVDPGHDYVIVGRASAVTMPFHRLVDEVANAFRAVRKKRTAGSKQSPRNDTTRAPRTESR